MLPIVCVYKMNYEKMEQNHYEETNPMLHNHNDDRNPQAQFIKKLWKLVNDPQSRNIVSWHPNGKSFFIHNTNLFCETVLPSYFKHRNVASFVRQLNMYGFKKVSGADKGSLKNSEVEVEFQHPHFQRQYPTFLERIKRKGTTEGKTESKLSENLENVMSEVKVLKNKTFDLNSEYHQLMQFNKLLYKEILRLKSQNSTYAYTVTKLIELFQTLLMSRFAKPYDQNDDRNLSQQLKLGHTNQQNLLMIEHNKNESDNRRYQRNSDNQKSRNHHENHFNHQYNMRNNESDVNVDIMDNNYYSNPRSLCSEYENTFNPSTSFNLRSAHNLHNNSNFTNNQIVPCNGKESILESFNNTIQQLEKLKLCVNNGNFDFCKSPLNDSFQNLLRHQGKKRSYQNETYSNNYSCNSPAESTITNEMMEQYPFRKKEKYMEDVDDQYRKKEKYMENIDNQYRKKEKFMEDVDDQYRKKEKFMEDIDDQYRKKEKYMEDVDDTYLYDDLDDDNNGMMDNDSNYSLRHSLTSNDLRKRKYNGNDHNRSMTSLNSDKNFPDPFVKSTNNFFLSHETENNQRHTINDSPFLKSQNSRDRSSLTENFQDNMNDRINSVGSSNSIKLSNGSDNLFNYKPYKTQGSMLSNNNGKNKVNLFDRNQSRTNVDTFNPPSSTHIEPSSLTENRKKQFVSNNRKPPNKNYHEDPMNFNYNNDNMFSSAQANRKMANRFKENNSNFLSMNNFNQSNLLENVIDSNMNNNNRNQVNMDDGPNESGSNSTNFNNLQMDLDKNNENLSDNDLFNFPSVKSSSSKPFGYDSYFLFFSSQSFFLLGNEKTKI
ncbi:hypothetical protein SNEBB_003737 [Seison nebaliae]|nr:hypothetical protein SNEBB_003737 [Seison nebaliae]